jgi:predicted DNA-binding protein
VTPVLKKTSIYLDDELDHRLARRAADEGVTKAELIRRVLTAAVSRPTRVKPQAIGFEDRRR